MRNITDCINEGLRDKIKGGWAKLKDDFNSYYFYTQYDDIPGVDGTVYVQALCKAEREDKPTEVRDIMVWSTENGDTFDKKTEEKAIKYLWSKKAQLLKDVRAY